MPWVNNTVTPNDYHWYGLNTYNQEAAYLTVSPGENFSITEISVYASARSSPVLTRLGLWNNGGGLIAQSDSFTMAVGSESVGGQAWQNKYISTSSFPSGTQFLVGLYRNPNGAHIGGTNTSFDSLLKTNTAGFPSISAFSGSMSADYGEGLLVGIFYIMSPTAPSSANATRNSDTSITINWTNNSSTDRPYTNQTISRYDNVSGNWYNIATVSNSATSYTDTTCVANRQYMYSVKATNSVGDSSWTGTDFINTTPSAPSNVVAVSSGTSVIISWTDNSTNENGFKIQSSEYTGGAWQAWQDETTVSAGTTSWTDTTPPNIVKYQVRAYTNVYGSLNSAYTSSNELTILQAPSAPTNLSPDNTYFDATASKIFTWQHNPLDGSSQTKYSIQYKVEGGSYPGTPQINEQSSSTSSHTFAADTFSNATTYKYQVKTWGAYSTGSDWSVEKTFYCAAVPVGTITSPTAVSDYTTSLLTMTWDFTGNTQIEYLAKLYDSNNVLIETQSGSGNAENVNFNYLLLNNSTYTVTLQVKDNTNLWSVETSVEFDTAFSVPPTPTFALTKNETTGTVNIEITNPSPEGAEIEAVTNNVYRSIDGENYDLILEDVTLNSLVTDYIPALGIPTYYIVEAVSATPTVARAIYDDITLTCNGMYFLNTGSNYLTYIILNENVELTEKSERKTVLQQFEGRNYPVKYQSEELAEEINFLCDIKSEDLNDVKAMVQSLDDLFYRDYSGRWFDCAITNPNFSKQENGRIYNFRCNIIQIEKE